MPMAHIIRHRIIITQAQLSLSSHALRLSLSSPGAPTGPSPAPFGYWQASNASGQRGCARQLEAVFLLNIARLCSLFLSRLPPLIHF